MRRHQNEVSSATNAFTQERVQSNYRDYTGVAVWQMSEMFHRYGSAAGIDAVANRANMDPSDLRKIVNNQGNIVGLKTADKILMAMGQNISSLSIAGEITIIPVAGKAAPRKMAEDVLWLHGVEEWLEIDESLTEAEILDLMTQDLARLRDYTLSETESMMA